jgi:hypothetical protein
LNKEGRSLRRKVFIPPTGYSTLAEAAESSTHSAHFVGEGEFRCSVSRAHPVLSSPFLDGSSMTKKSFKFFWYKKWSCVVKATGSRVREVVIPPGFTVLGHWQATRVSLMKLIDDAHLVRCLIQATTRTLRSSLTHF